MFECRLSVVAVISKWTDASQLTVSRLEPNTKHYYLCPRSDSARQVVSMSSMSLGIPTFENESVNEKRRHHGSEAIKCVEQEMACATRSMSMGLNECMFHDCYLLRSDLDKANNTISTARLEATCSSHKAPDWMSQI